MPWCVAFNRVSIMPTENENPKILQDRENKREERIEILRLEKE